MTELEMAIREKLKDDHVSFAELSRIEGFEGDLGISVGGDLNIYLWIGLSEEASAILKRLQDEGVFHYKPASTLVYLCDGRALTLPIAKAVRAYRKPRWAPVSLKLGPEPKKRGRGRR